jgi:hypothetical protein
MWLVVKLEGAAVIHIWELTSWLKSECQKAHLYGAFLSRLQLLPPHKKTWEQTGLAA